MRAKTTAVIAATIVALVLYWTTGKDTGDEVRFYRCLNDGCSEFEEW